MLNNAHQDAQIEYFFLKHLENQGQQKQCRNIRSTDTYKI